MFQKLRLLILVLRVSDISVLRFGKYNLRNWTYFDVPKVEIVNPGSESVRYLGPKIWEVIPTHIKELVIIGNFKIAIKKWKSETSPCRLWKVYLQNIGYI